MKLIQCVNDSPYIIWQLYVQMLNFRDFGYEQDAVVLVNSCSPSPTMLAFQKWSKASIFFYNDTRRTSNYFSSFRPNLIKQYLADHPTDCFFYHDQDIIFRRKVDIEALRAGRSHFTAGEASSYLRVSYLETFTKYNHLKDMCDIVDIREQLVRVFDEMNCVGGAQYVIKGTDYEFWDKVERDCELIYTKLKSDVKDDTENGVHHIQVWTADMWALLYNLYRSGRSVLLSPEIDFVWPWESKDSPKPILHNAGIDETNQRLKETGLQVYFHKNSYQADTPFEHDHSYVLPGIVQHEYLAYFKRAFAAMGPLIKRRRVLGIFCTHNNINPELLKTVLNRIKIAQENSLHCEVQIVTCSWEKIPDNPFRGLITPFRVYGHLNYLLQIRQVMATYRHNDIICILEHDMLYPDNYFDFVCDNWSEGKYGVYNMNYIGMNDTGYLKVRQRDCPMSLCSAARFYFDRFITRKIDEAMDKLSSADPSVYVEPPIEDFKLIDYTGDKPCIHVNMNKRGDWGSGREGKNHHFTNHCEVCYEEDSNGVTNDQYWGHYKELIPA
jgi:hypothetical protein